MSKLVINDLEVSKDLDTAAVMKICGGFSTGWLVARTDPQPVSGRLPGGIYNITNNYVDYDFNVYQNPTIFNVYNGDGNTGTIVNSFNTLSVNAASPALIG